MHAADFNDGTANQKILVLNNIKGLAHWCMGAQCSHHAAIRLRSFAHAPVPRGTRSGSTVAVVSPGELQ